MTFAALFAVLLTAKAIAMAGHHLVMSGWAAIAFMWHDAAIALAFAAIEASMQLRRGTSREVPSRWRTISVFALYVAAVAYVVANVPVTRVLATPMTGPMWRAARGPLADSIRRYATLDIFSACLAVAGVGFIAPVALSRVPRSFRRPLIAALALVVMFGPVATARIETRGLERNAWTALVGAVVPRDTARSTVIWSRTGFDRARDEPLSWMHSGAAGRHVIFVSLESAGAQYLGLYGAQPDAMPNLSRLAQHAMVFEHAYAAYPESIKGLYSILCSAWPALDRDALSYERRRCPSIADVLARRGYRTALFHSGRFGYLGMDAVVRGRGYEVLADAGDISGRHESSFGIDEASTVARMLGWIDALPTGSRFFLTYLPVAGHHPYDTPDPGPYDDRHEQSRYLNALHYADASVGALMRGLDARGLTNDVLWIVAGDHGEAFGQHDGNFGHTFYIYEENVHVPLVIAAPGLITSEIRRKQVVSLVDVAPTVHDLVAGSAPPGYEGQTMIDGNPRMAFFAADYSRRMVGLRDGRFKAILTLDSDRTELFDLDADPGEHTNVAAHYPDRASWYERNLRNWAAVNKARR